MFPPNLQKNIRELDRQISLLETECANMKDVKETSISGKRTLRRNGIPSTGLMQAPRFRSAQVYLTANSLGAENSAKTTSLSEVHASSIMADSKEGKIQERSASKKTPASNSEETAVAAAMTRESNWRREDQKLARGSLGGSKAKTGESSDENLRLTNPKSLTEETFSKVTFAEDQKRKIKSKPVNGESTKKALTRHTSSGEDEEDRDRKRGARTNLNEHSMSVDRVMTARKSSRLRSTRTKRKCDSGFGSENKAQKAPTEKEIQPARWSEHREKNDFLICLNDSIHTLHSLIREFKKKSSQEKKNDGSDNVTPRHRHSKSPNARNGFLLPLSTFLRGENETIRETEENIMDLKKALHGVKQFCEELTEEKSFLTRELAQKDRIIVAMRNREKELLSVVSALKADLEKAKEECEELTVAKIKLHEETKVTEALKKGHAKMQELVASFVLENDKLKTRMRLSKLETQKYQVLLAGKEEEIQKYKREMGSFHKQICDQLNVLRSKASENQMEYAIKSIKNHASFLSQTKIESFPFEIDELGERFSPSSPDTSPDSFTSKSQGSAREEPQASSSRGDSVPRPHTSQTSLREPAGEETRKKAPAAEGHVEAEAKNFRSAAASRLLRSQVRVPPSTTTTKVDPGYDLEP